MMTAAREAREETGFAVEVTGFLGMWLDRYPDPSDPAARVTLNAYYHATGRRRGGRARPGRDVGDRLVRARRPAGESPSPTTPRPSSPPGGRR